jgi:hypothetical protein
MRIFGKTKSGKRGYQSERGAALVTVLLISVPLLMAGGGSDHDYFNGGVEHCGCGR